MVLQIWDTFNGWKLVLQADSDAVLELWHELTNDGEYNYALVEVNSQGRTKVLETL